MFRATGVTYDKRLSDWIANLVKSTRRGSVMSPFVSSSRLACSVLRRASLCNSNCFTIGCNPSRLFKYWISSCVVNACSWPSIKEVYAIARSSRVSLKLRKANCWAMMNNASASQSVLSVSTDCPRLNRRQG